MPKLKIDKNTEENILKYIISESFIPKSELVLSIKSYLDKNFSKQMSYDVVGGEPKEIWTVSQLSQNNGMPLQTLSLSDLLLKLDDKFNNKIKNDNDRKNFLKQVIIDWLTNKITKEGILTKNYL